MRIEAFLFAFIFATGVQNTSRAAALSDEHIVALAQNCAPNIDAAVFAAMAHVESHLDPLALRNNSKHISMAFSSRSASARQAKEWISEGDSVDLGLMQINSSNLRTLGLTVETALDACQSLKAGARVLSAAYERGSTAADRQAALLIALSRYNTGRTLAGIANGYVDEVLTAQVDEEKVNSKPTIHREQKLPVWNIWAVASDAQRAGAAWLIGSQDTHDFLVGAGAQPTGEPHALSKYPEAAPGT